MYLTNFETKLELRGRLRSLLPRFLAPDDTES